MKHLGGALVLVVVWAGFAVGRAEVPPEARIPVVRAASLAGDAVALPEGLRGKVGVLVIGFSRGSQPAVTAWAQRLAADYRESPTVVYYEMAMLAGAPRLVRGLILRQMRSSVPERAWPRFLPLTEDEKAWRAVTHYTPESGDDAYVLVLDGMGIVRWRAQGAPTDAMYGVLKQQVSVGP